MTRYIFLIFTCLVFVQVNAQEDLFELVVKGKKQGVKKTNSEGWLIPLEKQTIIEPHENLFLIIDQKNQLVKGFYQDEHFKKETPAKRQLFFGQNDFMEDLLVFEQHIIDTKKKTITRPRFKYPSNGLRGPGAGFFYEKLIVAAASDSLGLYTVGISDLKNGLIQQFSDIEFCITEGLFLVGHTRQIPYDPVFKTSYEVEKIEVFEIDQAGLEKVGSYQKSDVSDFEFYMQHLRGYAYGRINNSETKEYDNILNTDYRRDSAEKYDLIFETGSGIFFANPTVMHHLSKKGEWETVASDFFYRDNYDFGERGYFSLENLEGRIIINNYVIHDELIILEEQVDGGGLTEFYAEVEDVQMSGVWDWSMNKWIVPNEYAEVVLLNDLYLAQKTIYSEHETDEHRFNRSKQLDIYNKQGDKVKSLSEPKDEEVLKAVYGDVKISKIEDTYSIFEVKDPEGLILLDFSEYLSSTFCIASSVDGVIPGSYNSVSHSFISQKGKKFFLNQYDVEIGVTTREITTDFATFMSLDIEGYGLTINFSDQISQDEIGQQILSGVYRINENQMIIFNNTFPETYEKYNEYGELQEVYDEYGNAIYSYYYPRKGASNSGIWNNVKKEWDITPEYYKIIPTEYGYTCLKRLDKVNGKEIIENEDSRVIQTDNYNNPVADSFSLDLYGKKFEIQKKNLNADKFINNPENTSYFLSYEGLGNCVNHPESVDEKYDLYDTYGGCTFKGDKGYALVLPNHINFSKTIFVSGMDWIYESPRYVYAIRQDSLYIYNFDIDYHKYAALKLKGGFTIEEFENINLIQMGEQSLTYFPNSEGVKIEAYTGNEKGINNSIKIEYGENRILCQSFSEDQIYPYLFDEVDPFEAYLRVKSRNDFLWKKNQGKWNIAFAANTIQETPFGYFVDSTFIIQDIATPFYFTDDRFNGTKTLLDKNLRKISELPLNAYYGSSPVDGRSDLYIVQYGSDDRSELMGIISQDGKIAVEACDHQIKGNTLEYSPCSPDGLGGPAFDDFGNQVVKTIELK